MFSLFKLLPLELLDRLCSYLKAEDILTLRKILPTVTHCPRYKRLMGKTRCFNRMWNEIAEYREIHENCIHVCLPEITVNPHNDHDAYMEDEDSLLCYFHGRSIFCLAANELSGEIDSRYGKQIVPLKKHIHCNCEKVENNDILCEVHEDIENYEESISFLKRMEDGGYVEVKDTVVEISSTAQTDESVSIELTQSEIEQLFEEF
jgi:hypothetical protein